MRVLMALADGTEEMEAVITIDVLRRGGVDVDVAAVGENREIRASRGVRIVADQLWREVTHQEYDALVIPGGAEGVKRLRAEFSVLAAARGFAASGKLIAAVCAGPLVLQDAGILTGRRATCHPGVRPELTQAVASDDRVVEDGPLITSQGPGTTFEFVLAVLAKLTSKANAAKVAKGMVLAG